MEGEGERVEGLSRVEDSLQEGDPPTTEKETHKPTTATRLTETLA